MTCQLFQRTLNGLKLEVQKSLQDVDVNFADVPGLEDAFQESIEPLKKLMTKSTQLRLAADSTLPYVVCMSTYLLININF